MYLFNSKLSPEFKIWKSNSLFNISISMSNRHLQCNISQTALLISLTKGLLHSNKRQFHSVSCSFPKAGNPPIFFFLLYSIFSLSTPVNSFSCPCYQSDLTFLSSYLGICSSPLTAFPVSALASSSSLFITLKAAKVIIKKKKKQSNHRTVMLRTLHCLLSHWE